MTTEWGYIADSWDVRWDLTEVGLMEWIEDVERMAYELRNCRRNSYAGFGDSCFHLVAHLRQLALDLQDIAENIERHTATMESAEGGSLRVSLGLTF